MSDLISRKGVLKILTDISYNICKTEAGADDINTAKLMVIAMPSAERNCEGCRFTFYEKELIEKMEDDRK